MSNILEVKNLCKNYDTFALNGFRAFRHVRTVCRYDLQGQEALSRDQPEKDGKRCYRRTFRRAFGRTHNLAHSLFERKSLREQICGRAHFPVCGNTRLGGYAVRGSRGKRYEEKDRA